MNKPRTLPTNDQELNAIVFKGAGVYEPRSLEDYFNIDELSAMLNENNTFSRATRDWIYNAVDGYLSRLCSCGSGLEGTWQYDARGIELCKTCDKCHDRKMSSYRPEVLTDASYDCCEQIEGE